MFDYSVNFHTKVTRIDRTWWPGGVGAIEIRSRGSAVRIREPIDACWNRMTVRRSTFSIGLRPDGVRSSLYRWAQFFTAYVAGRHRNQNHRPARVERTTPFVERRMATATRLSIDPDYIRLLRSDTDSGVLGFERLPARFRRGGVEPVGNIDNDHHVHRYVFDRTVQEAVGGGDRNDEEGNRG